MGKFTGLNKYSYPSNETKVAQNIYLRKKIPGIGLKFDFYTILLISGYPTVQYCIIYNIIVLYITVLYIL